VFPAWLERNGFAIHCRHSYSVDGLALLGPKKRAAGFRAGNQVNPLATFNPTCCKTQNKTLRQPLKLEEPAGRC